MEGNSPVDIHDILLKPPLTRRFLLHLEKHIASLHPHISPLSFPCLCLLPLQYPLLHVFVLEHPSRGDIDKSENRGLDRSTGDR